MYFWQTRLIKKSHHLVHPFSRWYWRWLKICYIWKVITVGGVLDPRWRNEDARVWSLRVRRWFVRNVARVITSRKLVVKRPKAQFLLHWLMIWKTLILRRMRFWMTTYDAKVWMKVTYERVCYIQEVSFSWICWWCARLLTMGFNTLYSSC